MNIRPLRYHKLQGLQEPNVQIKIFKIQFFLLLKFLTKKLFMNLKEKLTLEFLFSLGFIS